MRVAGRPTAITPTERNVPSPFPEQDSDSAVACGIVAAHRQVRLAIAVEIACC
jgi:hypothetical protein